MNTIRFTVSALCAAVLAAGTVHAADNTGNEQLHTWSVEIGADGRVIASQLFAGDGGGYADAVEQQLRSWHFQPDRTGQANAVTDTFVRVVSRAAADGSPQLVSVGVGPAPRHLTRPDYPVSAQRMGDEGVVVLRLQLDAEGRVQAREVQQTEGHVTRRMASAALAAARDWRFQPERINGQAVAGEVLMPVCFYVGEDPSSVCRWQGPTHASMSGLAIVSTEPTVRLLQPLASN